MSKAAEVIGKYCEYLGQEMPEINEGSWIFPFDANLVVKFTPQQDNRLMLSMKLQNKEQEVSDVARHEALLKVSTAIQDQVTTTISHDLETGDDFLFQVIDIDSLLSMDINEIIDKTVDDFEYVSGIIAKF
ncbi:MAG: CesT family type III secretion system chaperone [Methylocystaceae bacterium]|nr:CesT family type III secretion system chaperone [Methylocystaceae bacterium]